MNAQKIRRDLAALREDVSLRLETDGQHCDFGRFGALLERCLDELENGETFLSSDIIRLGNLSFFLEQHDVATRLLQAAAEQALAKGEISLVGAAMMNLGNVAGSRHQFAAAARFYQQAADFTGRVDDDAGRIEALIGLAQALKRTGQDDLARRTLEQALEKAEGRDLTFQKGRALAALAFFDYAAKDFAAAISKLQQAITLFDDSDRSAADRVNAYYNIALVYADNGCLAQARESVEQAHVLAERYGIRYGDNRIGRAMEAINELTQDSGHV